MSFDWRAYLDLSKELIDRQRTTSLKEAYLRSAVSRAYYGIFCTARKELISKTAFFSKEASHKEVREHFNNAASRKEKQIGAKLGRLWTERKAADYNADETFDDSRARTVQQIAEDTLKLLEEMAKPQQEKK